MRRLCALFCLLCLLLPLLAACGAAPDEIRLEPLNQASTPPLAQSERPVRVATPFGPAVTAALPSPEPTDEPSPSAEPDSVPVERSYVLNTSSRRFHLPGCSSVGEIKETNRENFFGTRDELLAKGYKPCGRCKP